MFDLYRNTYRDGDSRTDAAPRTALVKSPNTSPSSSCLFLSSPSSSSSSSFSQFSLSLSDAQSLSFRDYHRSLASGMASSHDPEFRLSSAAIPASSSTHPPCGRPLTVQPHGVLPGHIHDTKVVNATKGVIEISYKLLILNPNLWLASHTSTFRPKVPAKDRLSAWHSPYAIARKEQLMLELPPSVVDAAFSIIPRSYAPSTRTDYASGIQKFNDYCDSKGVSETSRVPASPALLAAFVSEYAGANPGTTVKAWISGIRAWHIAQGAPWLGDDEWVHSARTAASKEGSHLRRDARPPVSLDHLRALRRALSLVNPKDVAIWAVAPITFFGCRRLGETTVKSIADFNPKFNVTKSTRMDYSSSRGYHTLTIHIPWTKTTREKGSHIIITSRPHDPLLCPVNAITNFLSINGTGPDGMSFFAFKSGTNAWSHVTRDLFLKTASSAWKAARLPDLSGHSFRIGGTTELLLEGVALDMVAAIGGWSSMAFLLYWRRLGGVISQGTADAYAKKHGFSFQDGISRYEHRNRSP